MENGLLRSLGICWLDFSLFIYIIPSLVEGMGVEPQALSAVFRPGDRPLVVAGVGCLSRRLYQCRHLEIAHDLTMGNLLEATAYQYEMQVKDEVGNASALIAGSFITSEAPDSGRRDYSKMRYRLILVSN